MANVLRPNVISSKMKNYIYMQTHVDRYIDLVRILLSPYIFLPIMFGICVGIVYILRTLLKLNWYWLSAVIVGLVVICLYLLTLYGGILLGDIPIHIHGTLVN